MASSQPTTAFREPGRRPTLLILGELEPQRAHLDRLHDLGVDVERCPASARPDGVRRALAGADFVFVNNMDANPFLENFGRVRLTVVAATGYDWLDVRRARELGLVIANLPAYSAVATTEYMVWGAFAGMRPFAPNAARVGAGDWLKASRSPQTGCARTTPSSNGSGPTPGPCVACA